MLRQSLQKLCRLRVLSALLRIALAAHIEPPFKQHGFATRLLIQSLQQIKAERCEQRARPSVPRGSLQIKMRLPLIQVTIYSHLTLLDQPETAALSLDEFKPPRGCGHIVSLKFSRERGKTHK